MAAPALLLLAALSAAPLGLAGSLSSDAGLEYDSNANRAPSDGSLGPDETPRGGPLLRALFNGQLRYAGERQRLAAQLQVGGKIFLTPLLQDQDVGVVAVNYEHGAQLGRLRLGALLDYYEAFQAPASLLDRRDFRNLTLALRLVGARPMGAARQHRLDGGLDVGGQLFMYKPDSGYTFLAPFVAGRLNSALHAGDPELGHDFDLGLHLRADYRGYLYGRTDVFVQGGLSVTWQGPLLLQLGYTAQLDLSNASDESYQRHLLLVKLAFRLPADFYITAKSQLNLLHGAPGLFVPVSNVDDDNRSLALLDVERALGRGVALSLRYTGYFSLPSELTAPYQRHALYLGLTYSWKGKRRPQPGGAQSS